MRHRSQGQQSISEVAEIRICSSGDRVRSRRLEAQSCKPALHFRCQLQVVPCASDRRAMNQVFSRLPSWVGLICLSSSQNSGKHFTYQITGSLEKDITLEQLDRKNAQGKAEWEGMRGFQPSPERASLPKSPRVHQPGRSSTFQLASPNTTLPSVLSLPPPSSLSQANQPTVSYYCTQLYCTTHCLKDDCVCY